MSKQKQRLLFIQNDEHLCSLYQDLMQLDGYLVDCRLTAKSGIEKFCSESYDLVVLDYTLPDKPGLEAAKEILLLKPEMLIVMVAEMGSEHIAAEVQSAGVANYVIKKSDDVFLEDLSETISRLLTKNEKELGALSSDDLTSHKDFYEAVANFSPVSIFVHAEGKIAFVNPAGVTLLGAGSADDIIGKPSLFIIPPDQHEEISERIEKVEKSGGFAPTIENQFIQISGKVIDVETRATIIDFKGKRARLVMVQDISERKKAENVLKDAIESIPEGFAYYDADDRLALFNKNFTKGREELNDILQLGMTFEEQALLREKSGSRDKYHQGINKIPIKERIRRHQNPPGEAKEEHRPDGAFIQTVEVKTPGGGIALIRTDITRLKEAEIALSQSHKSLETRVKERSAHLDRETNEHKRTRELLSMAIESISDGFLLYDVDNKLTMCNQVLKDMYPKIADILVPGTARENILHIATERGQFRYLAGQEAKFFNKIVSGFDNPTGRKILIKDDRRFVLAEDFKTEDGGTVGIRKDVTELIAAEQKVRESEARYRALIDNTPARITLVDQDGIFLLANKLYTEIAGVEEHEIVGTSSLGNDWLPKEIIAKNLREIKEVIEDQKLIVRERTMSPGKSNESHWEITKFPVFNDLGDIIAVGGIGMDVTARKKAEESLRLSEQATELEREKLQAGIDSLQECFVYFDQDEKLVNFNKSFADRYSYLGDKLKPGTAWEDINRGVYRNTLTSSNFSDEDDFVKQRKEQRYTKDGPVLRKHDDGTWVMITENPTPDGGTVVTILDFTDIKKVEEELETARVIAEEANRAKSEFLSSMSHELRTPLNAILGFSQMLEIDSESPLTESQSVAVSHIRKGGSYLLSLINDVLDLAKVEAGKLELSIECISIGQVYDDCLPLIEVRAGERNIKISEEFSRAVNLTVRADHTAIRQILLNLLSNAVKYNCEDGEIRIMFEELTDGMLRTSISDSGEGISIDLQSQLFQPFSRLGQETTNIEGTGIGLVVTKRLVESMQGRIGFESEIGAGSTFWFELPLSQEESAAKTIANDLAENESPQSLDAKVLYIEDNPANLDLMEMVISRVDGLMMFSAHTAELGLDLARIEEPDLIIMDINLPGMNGFRALQELKKFSATRDTPVIALSANATKKDIEKGQQAGFKEYLTKPVNIEEVTHAIRESIKKIH
jgi:PAS domain S-box-containing protein